MILLSIHLKKVILALFIGFLLLGCSSEDKLENDFVAVKNLQTEPIKQINFIGHWLGQGARETLIRDAVKIYEFQNQDTKVNLAFPEDVYVNNKVANYEAKFIVNTIQDENSKWDIIRIDGQYNNVNDILNDPNWAKDNLVDFSEIPEFREKTNPELLTDEFKKKLGGIIPGPILEGQFWTLYYNKIVADKIGLEIKNTGMTIDDFKEYLKTTNDYNNKYPDNYVVPISEAVNWRTSGILGVQMFASLFKNKNVYENTEYSGGRIEKWHRVLQELEELAKLNIYDKNNEEVLWLDLTKRMLNNEYLFFINGSWMYSLWLDADSTAVKNCYPVELPSLEPANIYPLGYNVTWGVPKNAPNKEEAIDFLLYMNSSDIAQKWVNNTKSPTGIKGRMTDVNFGNDQFENFVNYINTKYSKNSYNTRSDNALIMGINNSKIPTYDIDVLRGNMTADEAIAKIKEQLIFEAPIEEFVE